MSNSTRLPAVNNQQWADAADDAKDAAALLGDMASHAAFAVGAMAGQTACDVGKRVDDLTASAGAGIQGLGERLSKNSPLRRRGGKRVSSGCQFGQGRRQIHPGRQAQRDCRGH